MCGERFVFFFTFFSYLHLFQSENRTLLLKRSEFFCMFRNQTALVRAVKSLKLASSL